MIMNSLRFWSCLGRYVIAAIITFSLSLSNIVLFNELMSMAEHVIMGLAMYTVLTVAAVGQELYVAIQRHGHPAESD